MTFYERLERVCEKKGTSPFALSQRLGYSAATSSYWKTSKCTPRRATLSRICEELDLPQNYFELSDEEPAQPVAEPVMDAQPVGAMVMMPVIGEVKAGYGLQAETVYTGEFMGITADTMHGSPSEYRLLSVKGDSMYPFILPGDFALVHLQEDAESGETVVAILESGEATIKKLRRTDTAVELIAGNPLYPTVMMGNGDRLYGKVVQIVRNF